MAATKFPAALASLGHAALQPDLSSSEELISGRAYGAYSAPGRPRRGRLAAVRCARPDFIQRSTMGAGAMIVQASGDLDLDYWIFALR
jgi:hypothetical protein